MIERFELEDGQDPWSVAGRGTLIAGSVFGAYKTAQEMPSMSKGGSFRSSMGRHIYTQIPKMNKAQNPIESTVKTSSFLSEQINSQLGGRPFSTKDLRKTLGVELSQLGGGYKGRSQDLSKEIKALYSELGPDFEMRGFYRGKFGDGPLEMVSIYSESKGISFDIPLVQQSGQMVLGGYDPNIYTPRSVRKSVTGSGVELEGIDVALVKKYRQELEGILSGRIDPKDIKRMATDKVIYEETRGAKDLSKMSADKLQKLRLEQFVIDLWGEMSPAERISEMKNISMMPGYGGGSASMYSKFVMATPDSPLAKGMPGAEASISSYQLWRESSFVEGVDKPTIAWADDAAGLGEFSIATIDNKEALKRAAKKAGVTLGELADEEAILSDRVKGKISNMRGKFTVDIGDTQTKFAKELMDFVQSNAAAQGYTPEEIAKAMTSPGGLDGLNVDLNTKLEKMRARKQALGRDIDALDSWIKTHRPTTPEAEVKYEKLKDRLARKRAAYRKTNTAIDNYGILGYDEMGKAIRLNTDDYKNILKNVRVSADAKGQKRLHLSTESLFDFGIGSKLFTGGGGGKWTVKNTGDISMILGWMEAEKKFGSKATEAQAKNLAQKFKHIDMISAESPIRLKQGTLAPREGMTAIMSYATDVMRSGNTDAIKRLEKLGIVGGEFIGSELTGKQMIETIQGWHPGSTMEQLFGGKDIGGVAKESRMVMAADISSGQAGVGRLGTLSSRTAFNLEAMGLTDFLDDALGVDRRAGNFAAFQQFKEIEKAQGLAGDSSAAMLRAADIGDDQLDMLLSPNLEVRRGEFVGGTDGGRTIQSIDLGTEIDLGGGHGKLSKVNIYGADVMEGYVGQGKGGMTALDRATMDLIKASRDGATEGELLRKARKYQTAVNEMNSSIHDNLIGGKVKKSMYGQAASSLEGLDVYAANLGKKMGLKEGMQAPVIAMSKADIEAKFGKDALTKAKKGDLWGVITREPIEGIHSSLPTNIVMAEDFGMPGDMEGRVFISGEDASKSLMRKSLFVDFDKDTVNVIAATTDKASAAIKDFLGVGPGPQSAMGKGFLESVERMSSFDLKGRDPLSITALWNDEIAALNASQKHLEKGMIGQFSNEFKNVHIGLREQMTPTMGKGAAEAYYLGEDFSHLFVENVLKAKHQSKKALAEGSVIAALDVLKGTGDYRGMSKGNRALEMQRIMDELSFGSKEAADAVRASADEQMTVAMARKMGLGKDLKKAGGNEEAWNAVMQKAEKQRRAYRKVTSTKNLENIIEAHSLGTQVLKEGNYSANIGRRMLEGKPSLMARASDIAASTSEFMTKGLKNIGKWGILPAAGIGLMASLVSKPKVLSPATDAGAVHEQGKQKLFSDELGQASAPKTIHSIPEQKFSSFDIAGRSSGRTNFEGLQAFASRNSLSSSVRVHDHRSHMDKYTIRDMIDKGY